MRAHIPDETSYFAFVYPATFNEPAHEVKSKLSTLSGKAVGGLPLTLLGGFAYFDGAGKLLVINEIVGAAGQGGNSNRRDFGSGEFAGGLSFGERCDLEKKAQNALSKEERLVDVTNDDLSAMGAKKFGWINPMEFAQKDLGEAPNPFGCFAYTDGRSAVYFPIHFGNEEDNAKELEKRAKYAKTLLNGPRISFKGLDSPSSGKELAERSEDSSAGEKVPAASPTVKDPMKQVVQVLMMLCSAGKVDLVKELLDEDKKKGLIDAQDEDEFTPLMRAALGGHTNLVYELLSLGADATKAPSEGKKKGQTALKMAIAVGNFHVRRRRPPPSPQLARARARDRWQLAC